MLQHVINYSHQSINVNGTIIPAKSSCDMDVTITPDVSQLIKMGIIKLTNIVNSAVNTNTSTTAATLEAKRQARIRELQAKAAEKHTIKKVAAKGSSTSKGK